MSGVITPATYISGALSVSTLAALADTSSGKNYGSSGELLVGAGGNSVVANGFSLDSNGRLRVVAKAAITPPTTARSGMLFDATGALVTVDFSIATAPLVSQGEATFDADGALVTNGA